MNFKQGDIVQILFSKDPRGNSCITFAKIKEVRAEEKCVIVHHIVTFRGKSPLKAPEGAEIVMENSKIPFKRILKSSDQEILALQDRYRR